MVATSTVGTTMKVRHVQNNSIRAVIILSYILVLGVDSDAANSVMDLIRGDFVGKDVASISEDGSGIKLVDAEEFG